MGTRVVGGRVSFGPFELDQSGDLYREGVRLRLQEQPRQVLIALLERPGEIVTRDELRERLWKQDTFVDFDHSLNTAIKKVRQALGDSAENPQFIETLARRGYRFIAPVAVAPPPIVDVPAGPSSPTLAPVETSVGVTPIATPARLWVFGFLLTSLVVLLGWFVYARWERQSASPVRPFAHLAVLPLRVLTTSAGEAPSYLGVGLADAITTRLANVRQIALRPTSAVLPYENARADMDLARIGSALSVEHLLVGTIQEAENAYRVSLQLVRASDAVAVWGQTYDLPRADLLRLQDALAEQVAAALRLELTGTERARLARHSTDNPVAFDSYLRGRALLVNYTDAKMREAIAQFEEALEIDPHYELARAGLATAAAWFSVRYAYESEASEWGRRAEHEAETALREDASLAEAHLAIANAAGTLHRGFDWNTVLERSNRALVLDPSLDMAHVARMRAFYHLGLFDMAKQEAARARALNPTANMETERLEVAIHLFGGEFAAASQQASRLLLRTDAPAIPNYLGLARYYEGDVAGARTLLENAQRGGQADVRSQAALAAVEAAAQERQARTRADSIAHGPYIDHHVAYSLGQAYAQLGSADESITWLTRAADSGFPCYPWFVNDSLLDPLRRDQQFIELLGRLKQQHEATRSRLAGASD